MGFFNNGAAPSAAAAAAGSTPTSPAPLPPPPPPRPIVAGAAATTDAKEAAASSSSSSSSSSSPSPSPSSSHNSSSPPQFHRTVAGSAVFAGQAVVGSGVAGSTLGALLAVWKAQSPASWAFSMGANWVLLSVPFFTIREGVLHYRQRGHLQRGEDVLAFRDKDDMLGTLAAGAVVGGGLGRVARGRGYGLPGAMFYALLAGGIQMTSTVLRHWRLSAGARLRDTDDAILRAHGAADGAGADARPPLDGYALDRIKKQAWADRYLGFYRRPFDSASEPALAPATGQFDPVGAAVGWVRRRAVGAMAEVVDDVPAWLSPLVNALDMEYRVRLNEKTEKLERQVAALRARARELGLDVDGGEAAAAAAAAAPVVVGDGVGDASAASRPVKA
ncbi:hypothetical protein DFJ73DRAFT_798371 [Zopfochytrium polystomum]|nr:hypothetical protein DFJ73DRAFT_798371 [Zopfochytrium polystomum]